MVGLARGSRRRRIGAAALLCRYYRPRLAQLSPPLPELERELWLLTHPDLRNTARVRAFLDYCTEAIARRRDIVEGRAGTETNRRELGPSGNSPRGLRVAKENRRMSNMTTVEAKASCRRGTFLVQTFQVRRAATVPSFGATNAQNGLASSLSRPKLGRAVLAYGRVRGRRRR